ncbi:hypothetical protein KGF57_002892 [Candida theae]|uniref:Uncharacterized protein n=1 Tax=Candida theae TaxID=1198502 RepID=A0AAD5BEU2_9ASCO|nr:uncharacterized protein KGF57_002892 [Candida theae]KAI5958084.1 hypothetical protein KGF57_002892 [Candida theae]
MHQIPLLNDRSLEKGFKAPSKYKNLQFFASKPSPMQSACGRTKSKKQFREIFVQSLQQFSPHQKRDRLFGIFVFHVAKVPVNQEQNNSIRKSIEGMFLSMLDDEKVWIELKRVLSKSKGIKQHQLKGIQYSYGVKGLVDTNIRFPFLKKKSLKAG